jgi:putative peptidoglycan lipid II flippase
MTSRILGLVREQVMAFLFGAGSATDAFNVAFRLPNLVRDLFAEGAMSAAFVPTFTSRLTHAGKADAWQLGRQIITALLLVTGVLVLIGMVAAEPIVRLFAARFADVPGKLELTVQLARIMLPFLTLIALAAAMMGMLNSLRHFFIPALSPAMFNVGWIVCALTLTPVMPRLGLDPVVALAIGVIVGGIGQVALQWPPLRREGFRYRPMLDPHDPALREVLRLMGPGVIGLAAVEFNLVVNTILATGEGDAAVSYLSYAFRLMYLPIGLFGVSVAMAAVPEISRYAARDDLASMRVTVSKGLRLMLMLSVPATFGLIVLATPIIALLFEYGKFDATDTAATAGALAFYAPGLLGYAAVKIAVPSFYALKDSRTPVLVSMMSIVVNLVLNVSLVRILSYRGLALGTGLAAIVNASVLLWLLRGRLGGIEGRRLVIAIAKIVAASLVMAGAAYFVHLRLAESAPGDIAFARAVRVGTSILVALVVLAAAARLLRIEEFNEALSRVSRRFKRPS